MKVQLTIQIHLKDRPKDHLGQFGETLVVGGKAPANMAEAVRALVESAAPFYAQCYDAAELNRQREMLAEWLKEARFR